ncbi:MAG TPA: hypothetical protein ENJ53_05615, partial [Phaeodactylibacter sp.]|nr:hypothetical protein [Phaeodactylibacter sp.]
LFIGIGSWLISGFTCGSSTSTNTNTFSFMDEGGWKSKPASAVSFALSSGKATIPADTKKQYKEVATRLKKNENRGLMITGNYYSSETGGAELGMKRAEAIKAELVKQGAPAESISTQSRVLNNIPTTKGKALYNLVDFSFMEKKTETVSDAAPVETKEPSVLDPFTLRFESGKSKLEMTSELRHYLDRALQYLSENEGTVLMVTGYTDNDGSSRANLSLSKSRAAKVRRFLRKNGVKSAQVKYQGKGEANPVGSNDTSEGKAMNRRVEITIQ